jgi:hypothetical protein
MAASAALSNRQSAAPGTDAFEPDQGIGHFSLEIKGEHLKPRGKYERRVVSVRPETLEVLFIY